MLPAHPCRQRVSVGTDQRDSVLRISSGWRAEGEVQIFAGRARVVYGGGEGDKQPEYELLSFYRSGRLLFGFRHSF